MFSRKKGFTLIELLVVVAIIGLLASVVLASLNSARMKARDAKRKEDLHSIQTALALYYNTYGYYPPSKPSSTNCGGTGGDVWSSSIGTCGGQWLTTDSNFYQFMPSVPVDPLNSGQNAGWSDGNNVYSYATTTGTADYELVTQLENTSDSSRCATRESFYHNGGVPWCAPWPSNLGRSQNIYTDH